MAVATEAEDRGAADDPRPVARRSTRAQGALAGVVAAGAALGVSELVCGLAGRARR